MSNTKTKLDFIEEIVEGSAPSIHVDKDKCLCDRCISEWLLNIVLKAKDIFERLEKNECSCLQHNETKDILKLINQTPTS